MKKQLMALEMTVANAAPVTSMRGKKPMPKIMRGSRMILVMAPNMRESMGKKVFPCPRSTSLATMEVNRKTPPSIMMRVY